ncbi:unnamed protein product, partial [Tuber aestivum]
NLHPAARGFLSFASIFTRKKWPSGWLWLGAKHSNRVLLMTKGLFPLPEVPASLTSGEFPSPVGQHECHISPNNPGGFSGSNQRTRAGTAPRGSCSPAKFTLPSGSLKRSAAGIPKRPRTQGSNRRQRNHHSTSKAKSPDDYRRNPKKRFPDGPRCFGEWC